MKRIRPFVICFAALAWFVSCEDFAWLPDQKTRVPLEDFEVGIFHKSSLLDKALKKEADYFSAFITSEMFDYLETHTPDPTLLEGQPAYKRNKVEYQQEPEGTDFVIHTKPLKDVEILSVYAASSDTTVMKVLGATPEAVRVRMKKLGDTDLTVQLDTEEESVVHVYPLRVIGTVDLKFRITPYWLRKAATKIRMNIKGIPEGSDDLVLLTKDSVTIHAYCEWYDFENTGRQPHVERYDVTLPMRSKMVRYKRNTLHLLRDITSQIRDICEKYEEGTMIEQTTVKEADGTEKTTIDTVAHKYYYVPENVELDVLIVCDNPFVEFLVRVKAKKTFDVLNGTGGEDEIIVDWSEDPGDIGDQVVDESLETEDDMEPDEEWERETSNYFTVRLNDFLTQAQRDSIMAIVNEKKRQYGYDKTLSEEEKDKAMEKINEVLEEEETKEGEEEGENNGTEG